MMDALDGNAIGGLLIDVFGAELTADECECAHCGAVHVVAEERVYLRGPGTIVRCSSCGGVVMALVTIRDLTCVDLRGLSRLGPSARP